VENLDVIRTLLTNVKSPAIKHKEVIDCRVPILFMKVQKGDNVFDIDLSINHPGGFINSHLIKHYSR